MYNPPGFPFNGGRFHNPYASTFQAHTPQARFQAAPPHRSLSIPSGPSAAAGAWHSGLSPHSYYRAALPKSMKKCYGCGDNFSEKFRQPPHNTVVKHFDHRVVRKDESTGALVHSADFANTYYHPGPVHIMRKNPVFDGRVHIDLSTYHSLDEGQREMLKAFGLIVNVVLFAIILQALNYFIYLFVTVLYVYRKHCRIVRFSNENAMMHGSEGLLI